MSDLFDKSIRTLELPRVLELLSEHCLLYTSTLPTSDLV